MPVIRSPKWQGGARRFLHSIQWFDLLMHSRVKAEKMGKKLTNIRASGTDEAVRLTTPITFNVAPVVIPAPEVTVNVPETVIPPTVVTVLDDAVRAVHTAFGLDSSAGEAVVYGGTGR